MELNEIIEKNNTKEISEKTNISAEDVETLFAKDFGNLNRVKALGFISIVEREYKTKLKSFKKEALEYYDGLGEDQENVTITKGFLEEKKGRSVWFYIAIFSIFAYATWYFLTKFDHNKLTKYMSFMENNITEAIDKK